MGSRSDSRIWGGVRVSWSRKRMFGHAERWEGEGQRGGETKGTDHAVGIWWRVCWRDELADGAVGGVGDEASGEAVDKNHDARVARQAMGGEGRLPARVRELDVGYWTKYTSEGQNKELKSVTHFVSVPKALLYDGGRRAIREGVRKVPWILSTCAPSSFVCCRRGLGRCWCRQRRVGQRDQRTRRY